MMTIVIIIIIYKLSFKYISVTVPGHTKFLPLRFHYISNDYSLSMLSSSSSFVTSQASVDLFRPRLTVSSKVFKVVFLYMVYNSALFLASCCFLLGARGGAVG